MANLDILQNMVEATVTSGGTDAPPAGTVETFTVTTTENWTVLGANQQMRVMDIIDANSTGGYEIMLATVNANGTGVSWTVTRGVENTTPKTHAANWTMIPAFTAAGVPNSVNALSNPMTTAGDLITATTGGTPERLAIGANGTVLGVVSGALGYVTPFADPMTTAGDLIIGGTSGAADRLGIGSTGQVLTVVDGAPAWANGPSNITVTSPAGGDTSATTLQGSDLGAERQAGASITYTVPSDTSLGSAFVQGEGRFFVVRTLNGFAVTLAAASGVTLDGETSVPSNQTAFIEEVAADTWVATVSGSGGGAAVQPGQILAYVSYDPSTGSSFTTDSSTMTAINATDVVVSFDAPASGQVWAEFEAHMQTSNSADPVYMAVLSGGSSVGGEMAVCTITTGQRTQATWLITGLTPEANYTFEPAWAIGSSATATITYGGSDNGAVLFRIVAG